MAARLMPTSWCRHLEEARVSALDGDAEGVHQVRVAARRLRVWLTLGGHRALQDDLRWLCRALGPMRDLDVFDEVLTPAARDRLRPAARAQAFAALRSRRVDALLTALAKLGLPTEATAHRALHAMTLPEVDANSSLEDLHARRRAVRRLRYAREWLELDASELQREQEALGVLCDLLALRNLAASSRSR